jgi:hypothetical protein
LTHAHICVLCNQHDDTAVAAAQTVPPPFQTSMFRIFQAMTLY